MSERERRTARRPGGSKGREGRPGASSSVSSPLADLQAALGNLELQRRLATPAVQPKLRVSEPGDAHEREADRMADAVMRAPDPAAMRQGEEEEELAQTKLEVARQEEEEELAQTKLEVARQEEEEELAQTKLEAARQEDEEDLLQTKSEAARQEEDEEEIVQAKAGGAPAMTPAVESGIAASRGAGHPLDSGARSFYEPRFGRDLGGVKVHTDSHAARLASDLNAQAFTVGRDVYFAGGKYQPGTESGRWLLAHELTHTVQQQPGAKLEEGGGAGVPAAPAVTRADRQVQRNGEEEEGGGEVPADAGTVHGGSEPKIVYPTLKLPPFKATVEHRQSRYTGRATSGELKRARDWSRGSPGQTDVWDGSLPDADMTSLVEGKLASTQNTAEPDKVYTLRHPTSDYHLIGTLPTLAEAVKRPLWDRDGNPRPKDVDHVVELQVSGWGRSGPEWPNQAEAAGNMELLDSQANSRSGTAIMSEVRRLVGLSRQHLHRPPGEPPVVTVEGEADFWHREEPPSTKAIMRRYDLVFSGIESGLEQAGRPDTNYWEWTEIRDGDHLEQFVPATGEGTGNEWAIFPFPTGGVPKRVQHTDGAVEPTTPAQRTGWLNPFWVTQIRLADPQREPEEGGDIGELTIGAPERDGGRQYWLIQNAPTIPVHPYPGNPNAGYLDSGAMRNLWRSLSVRGFSPIEIGEFTAVPGRGLQARGQLLPSVPIIADMGIDLVIDGDDLYLSKLFDTGDFDLPGPVEVTDSSIELFVGTMGLGARGNLGLAIEDVGQGRIEARVDTRDGFALSGQFTFDPELFDPPSSITMGYADGAFSGSGVLTIGPDRVRGIRTATITVAYAEGTLTATGDAQLDVPGLEQGTMSLTYSEEEGFAISGTFQLSSDVPGIRSGSVSAGVRRRPEGEGYMVSASGTAVPDIPGFDSNVLVSYEDGLFTAEATARYQRGMLDGSLRVGATNRALDDEGNPGDEPTDELRAFGGGSLSLTLAPWLQATAGVRITPEAEVEVTGRIGLPAALELFPARRYDRNIFRINLDIPIVGVAVAGQRIGIFATIGGGLDLSAGFGPGELRELELSVTYNPDHEEDTLVEGGAQFIVPADAGLRLFVRGALGAGIPIVSATAGLEIGGMLGIEGAVRAGVHVSWTPQRGIDLEADAEIYAEPVFTFDITGFVNVEADLFLATIELYSERWRFAELRYGSGLRLGAKFPIHYREGEPFDVSMDDIEFEIPDIDPMQLLTGLVDRIT